MFGKKISFGISWSLIACTALFCFYASQLLIIISKETEIASAYALSVGLEKKILLAGQKNSKINIQNKMSSNTLSNTVELKTNYGTITLELFPEKAPNTVANFEKLTKSGFYNGVKFHRVIKGFMIQGGDPQSKDNNFKDRWGTGGPGYKFNDEINPNDDIYKTGYVRGILAMANSGPNTNGSQFFIMHNDVNLPPSYTIFGKVINGIEVVDKIANVPTYLKGQVDRPLSDVIIESATVK
ncbi:MAG: peptidylprolyl isomerase [Patescibacteria group bacterium]